MKIHFNRYLTFLTLYLGMSLIYASSSQEWNKLDEKAFKSCTQKIQPLKKRKIIITGRTLGIGGKDGDLNYGLLLTEVHVTNPQSWLCLYDKHTQTSILSTLEMLNQKK